MFDPGNRREVIVSRRPTVWLFLKRLKAEPISCKEALSIYDQLETAKDQAESLGAHLVTDEAEHLVSCPANDPNALRRVARHLRALNGSP